jgi:hypothetical protein
MPSKKIRLVRAVVISIALVVGAAVLPDSISPLAAILFPGLIVSGTFWSEGLHSGMRDVGVWMMFAVMYATSTIFWTIVVYALQAIAHTWFSSRKTDK